MDDLWRQWQAFAQLATPRAPGAAGAPAGFATFEDAAERFAAATRSFRDGMAAGASAASAAAAAETFSNFLRDQYADFFKMPWASAPGWAQAQGWSQAHGAGAGPGTAAFELPALGLTREHQERMQRAAHALRDMDEAQRRLQRLWSDTLREAASAYVSRLGSPAGAPLTPEATYKLYDTWIDCAEEAYARTAHSEAFCDALADYVNAGSRLRRESSAGAEVWAKLLDLPTRHEVNTLAERLRVLEEQVRARPATGAGEHAAGPERTPISERAPVSERAAGRERGPRPRARRPPKGKP